LPDSAPFSSYSSSHFQNLRKSMIAYRSLSVSQNKRRTLFAWTRQSHYVLCQMQLVSRRWRDIRKPITPVCISSTVTVTEMHWLLQGNTNFGIPNKGNLTDTYFTQYMAVWDKLALAHVSRCRRHVNDESVLAAAHGNPSTSTHWTASRTDNPQGKQIRTYHLQLRKGYSQGTATVDCKFVAGYCIKSWMNLTFGADCCRRMKRDSLEVARHISTICMNGHWRINIVHDSRHFNTDVVLMFGLGVSVGI
jgi:hypothetical protein